MWFVFAAASAVCFGLRGILYQWTSQRPIDRNLLLFGVFLSGTVIALSVNLFAGQHWSSGAWIGALMGLFSYVANASMYRGFAVGKAAVIAMFTGLPPVVVVIMAYILWGEKLNLWQALSFVIIIVGLLLIRYSNDISWSNMKGAQWGIIAMFGFGITDLSSKLATMLGAQTLPTLAVMYFTGTMLFGLTWAMGRGRMAVSRREVAAATELEDAPSAAAAITSAPVPAVWGVTKTLQWGMIVGLTNISGMMLIMPAFRLGVTGLVSVVVAMNVALVLLYARFVLKERFTQLEVCGLTAAFIGVIILRLAA
ncbi:EamA family transporter [Paenibacillus xerothermodurans]|uniref:EamA family transporter n=1 Tax=Paenibacillus xerothermodurans TaxID=1977292 RepID=A0A2W1NB84_PAEXE|nr:DMT family transporter [Paenibacillus xerothermodurans]PZE20930.1 EamA family transporter [Paenibacillus xerothermodurans]